MRRDKQAVGAGSESERETARESRAVDWMPIHVTVLRLKTPDPPGRSTHCASRLQSDSAVPLFRLRRTVVAKWRYPAGLDRYRPTGSGAENPQQLCCYAAAGLCRLPAIFVARRLCRCVVPQVRLRETRWVTGSTSPSRTCSCASQ